ncbi:N-6 DNA methylase [Maribacter sp. HS]|uniref:N-6 DNA methylase n=1 Tax=Maribacter sp. HS TaxID=3110480 RepID=UPI003A839F29
MRKITEKLNSKLKSHFRELDKLGLAAEDSGIILYLLTLLKEKIDFQIKMDSNPVHNDLSLFQNEDAKLELSVEEIWIELNDVPQAQSYLIEVNKIFNAKLKVLSIKSYEKIIDILESLFEGDLENQFSQIFDLFLNLIAERQGKKSGEFLLPTEISDFLMDLARPKSDAKVFNPFAGYSTFGTKLKEEQLYHGQEIDKLIWAISMMRLNAYDRLEKSVLQNADTFTEWPSTSNYDLVIANPPFKLRLTENQQVEFPGIKTVEYFFIKEGFNLLNDKGKLISLVPLTFLNTLSSEKEIRKQLIISDVLETVITFPGGLLMQTNIPFAILVINKGKKNKNSVLFVQGDKYVKQENKHKRYLEANELLKNITSKLSGYSNNNLVKEPSAVYGTNSSSGNTFEISKERIIEHKFNLDIERYFLDDLPGTPLGDIVKILPFISKAKVNRWYLKNAPLSSSVKMLVDDVDLIKAKYVGIKDLKNDALDYHLDDQLLEESVLRKNWSIVKGNSFLISLIGKSFKPTLLNSDDPFIYVSSLILPIEIDTTLVDLDWFVNQLYNIHLTNQVSSLSAGLQVPRLSRKDFLSLKINLPSLKEQRQEIANLKGTNNEIESLETEIIQQNSFLRHTLAGPVTDLEDAIKNIDAIVSNIERDSLPNIRGLKPTEKHLFTLGEYLEDSKKFSAMILETVKSKLNASLDIESKPLSRIDLLEFTKSYVNRKNSTYPDFDMLLEYDEIIFIDSDGNEIKRYIKANEELLIRMYDNLIENAIKHGFTDNSKKRIEFYISAFVEDDDDNAIMLLVSNTGKPFPEDFDFRKLTIKGYGYGDNHGDGFGWWYINEIIRKFKGKWDIIDETGGEGLVNTDLATSVELIFPLIENYEEL